jgi:folate-dependent phosphoribosylglycinamide formyltransferase PurN
MTPPIALITSNPRLVDVLLQRHGQGIGGGDLQIPLAIWVRPSMRPLDRLRDLRRVLRRQAAINRTTPAAQFIHHVAFRWLARAQMTGSLAASVDLLRRGRRVVETESGNAPVVVDALRHSGCALGVIVGSDVLTRRTLEAIGLPLLNVHLGDPAFYRGRPSIFWEILGCRTSITLTLHQVIPQLDAGAILLQRECPIVWGPTLGETMARTRQRASPEIARLVRDGIRRMGEVESPGGPSAAGPLRTIPKFWESFRADRLCRERHAQQRR